MSSIDSVDVADAFATLYDALHGLRPGTTELEAWPDSSEFANGQADVTRGVRDNGTLDAELVADLTVRTAAEGPRLFGAVAGLDFILSAANDSTPSSVPVTSLLQERRRRYGAYLTSASRGAVLAKRVDQRQIQEGHESLADALGVLRVHPDTWSAVEYVVVGADLDHSHAPGEELRLAAVPMGAEDKDLRITSTTTKQGRRIYVAAPDTSLATRVPAAASALIGADIGLAPEVTLSNDILRAWQAASDPRSSPTWVFVGTGPVAGRYAGVSAPVGTGKTIDGDSLCPNRGVLLHGLSGEVIAVQDKRAGFTITPTMLASYGLAGAPAESHDEGMEHGSRLTVIESRAGRFAVYICEDLGREIDLAHQLVELGVTHLIVPILATAMGTYEWHRQSSSHIAQRAGTITVVVNSLMLGRFDDHDNPARTLLLAEPSPSQYRAHLHWENNPDAASMTPEQDATTARGRTTRSR